MVKAKLFPYAQSGIYYKKYGISPDRYFDKLREKHGSKVAVEIVDRNMLNALEEKQRNEQRILESECPFL